MAAIAIPSYQGFQKRAKSAEGKNLLGAVYTAVKALEAEKAITATTDLGVSIETNSYYEGVGFDKAGASGSEVNSSTLRAGNSVGAKCLYNTESSWTAGALAKEVDDAYSFTMDHSRNIVQNNNGKDHGTEANRVACP